MHYENELVLCEIQYSSQIVPETAQSRCLDPLLTYSIFEPSECESNKIKFETHTQVHQMHVQTYFKQKGATLHWILNFVLKMNFL